MQNYYVHNKLKISNRFQVQFQLSSSLCKVTTILLLSDKKITFSFVHFVVSVRHLRKRLSEIYRNTSLLIISLHIAITHFPPSKDKKIQSSFITFKINISAQSYRTNSARSYN